MTQKHGDGRDEACFKFTYMKMALRHTGSQTQKREYLKNAPKGTLEKNAKSQKTFIFSSKKYLDMRYKSYQYILIYICKKLYFQTRFES